MQIMLRQKAQDVGVAEVGSISWSWTRTLAVIYKPFCLDVADGYINGAPNETRTHLCRFASLAC